MFYTHCSFRFTELQAFYSQRSGSTWPCLIFFKCVLLKTIYLKKSMRFTITILEQSPKLKDKSLGDPIFIHL